MSLGQNEQNPNEYHLEEKSEDGNTYQTQLNSTITEKDLGMAVDDKLVFRDHVAQMTAKANRVVGIIRRSFDHLTEKTFIQLHASPPVGIWSLHMATTAKIIVQ